MDKKGNSLVAEAEVAAAQLLDTDEMQRVIGVYRERQSVLTIVRMLNHLISAIQQHRGVSLAQLAGDGLFVADVSKVQSQVNKRLWVMEHSCDHYDSLIPEHVRSNIQHSWNTVCHDWEGDALLENFEYHSFLIEQLLQLSTDLARGLGEPLALVCNLSAAAVPKASSVLNEWILSLVSRALPQLVEHLARIRGLATHAAVVGQCDEEQAKKLRYWLQCAEQENKDILRQIEHMGATPKNGWKSLAELKNYELKLAFFLNTVSRDIIHGDGTRSDARSLFTLGTEIIDAYVAGVDGAISVLQGGLEEELECWLSSGP
ncbi:MAG: hypothetical protein GYB33_16015 [Gammaproteobacteria bacterium]|nr:hypothetical protein [Gammaproteobacteria bacterium]